MLVNQFHGGEHSLPAPQMLATNEAVEYVNIDETKGTLCSVKDKVATGLMEAQYAKFYQADNRFIGFPIFTSFVNYNNDMLYCNEAGSGRIRGSNSYTLGLTPPTSVGPYTVDAAPAPIKSVELTAADTATTTALPKIDMLYMFVNTVGDVRSLAVKMRLYADGTTLLLDPGTSNIDVTYLASTSSSYRTITFSKPYGELGTSGVEIYRFYNGAWRLIGVLASTSSTFVDATYVIPGSNRILTADDFSALKGTYQYALTYYNTSTGAESGASALTDEIELPSGGGVTFSNLPVSTQANKKRLYRIGGVLNAFALVKELDMATTSYSDSLADTDIDGRILSSADYLPAPTGMTYIEQSAGMVFGAVGTKVRFTPPGKPDAWPAAYEIPFDSTVTGLAEVAAGMLVFTRYKTYILTGNGPSTIAKQLLDSNQGCVSPTSIQKLAGSAIWVSTDGICVSSGGPAQVLTRAKTGKLAINPASSALFDDVYYCLDSSGVTYVLSFAYGQILKRLDLDIGSFVIGNDTLYGWKAGQLYELFASTEDMEFNYLSPRFIEGRGTEAKAYKKFYFFAKGDIIVNIIIDDELVATAKLNSGDSTVVQPPQHQQRGFYVQFRITGKGELFELEYEAARRD